MGRTVVSLAALAALAVAAPAQAAYTVNIYSVGTDIVATGSGSLNLNALTFSGAAGARAFSSLGAGSGLHDVYRSPLGPGSFGGPGFASAISFSGVPVGLQGNGSLYVPRGYVSGTMLGASTVIIDDFTFASSRAVPGRYRYTWGTGADADSLTVNFGPVLSAVPEPTSWALMIAGLGATAGALRRRRRQAGVRFA